MKQLQTNFRKKERGNVLFLILIAVALFAALSYAVTSSTRGGGGDAGEETNLVQSSAITQYPSTIRTAIIRMIVNGVSEDELLFDSPENSFGDEITAGNNNIASAVFHPQGGGATKGTAPASVMAEGVQGVWVFSSDYQIRGIGTDGTTDASNDIVAFLPGIRRAVCERVNEELGITGAITTGVTTLPTPEDNDMAIDADGAGADRSGIGLAAVDAFRIGGTIAAGDSFSGQPFGCFQIGSGTGATFTYYHVLVER